MFINQVQRTQKLAENALAVSNYVQSRRCRESAWETWEAEKENNVI